MFTHLKNHRIFSWGVLTTLLVLSGCATSPDISVMQDQDADFTQYKTYAFVEHPSTDKAGYSSILTKNLKSAVNEEMQSRGYQLSESPDLLVNFFVKTREKTEVTRGPTLGVGVGTGMRHSRVGIYSAWPLYSGRDVSEYTEGTLKIDLVDAKAKQMVWEGVAKGRITEEFQEDLKTNITKVVEQIFEKYPHQAVN